MGSSTNAVVVYSLCFTSRFRGSFDYSFMTFVTNSVFRSRIDVTDSESFFELRSCGSTIWREELLKPQREHRQFGKCEDLLFSEARKRGEESI